MGGSPVGRGVHRDRLETLFMTCTDDSESDFAAIGDENLGEHRVQGSGFRVQEMRKATPS
jgi:hypothetical protein